jgi:hypothetical protein
MCGCCFHSLLCFLSIASTGVIWTDVSRCVCGCTPIFSKGVAVEESIVRQLCISPFSSTSEETLLQDILLLWYVVFENLELADLNKIGSVVAGSFVSPVRSQFWILMQRMSAAV